MLRKFKICSSCKLEKPIFKNTIINGERQQLCINCASKTNKKLTSRTKKKVKEDAKYSKLRKSFLEKHPMCQINTGVCQSIASEIHHTEYRVGGKYLDTETWKSSCRACHEWVHLNPQVARELNLLK